jgi:hypothetical protein
MVGVIGFESAITCIPKMSSGAAPAHTARMETQTRDIPAPRDLVPDAQGALNARGGMDYGARVGREVQFPNAIASWLEAYAKLVAEAVARRDFERARELIDEAVSVEEPCRKKT